jgi:acetyl esterase/lipase
VQPDPGPEVDRSGEKNPTIAGKPVFILGNVSNPTLTVYAPAGKNSGTAVVVFPGGGYGILAIDLEGSEVCDWLNSEGITCILLKYRVPNEGPYPKFSGALQDAQRTMGLVRLHAADWHIDPHKVGVLGFSAGGHLVAALSTHFDRRIYEPVDAADNLSCRPDFSALVYPAYLTAGEKSLTLKPDLPVNAQTPPAFIVQAEDDHIGVENAVSYFMALKSANVPAELHAYAEGGHGYGLRHTSLPVTTWPRSMETWLHTVHMLP